MPNSKVPGHLRGSGTHTGQMNTSLLGWHKPYCCTQEPRGRRGNIKQGNSYLPLTKGTNYAREVFPRMLGSTSRGQGALEISKKIIYAQKSLKRESHRQNKHQQRGHRKHQRWQLLSELSWFLLCSATQAFVNSVGTHRTASKSPLTIPHFKWNKWQKPSLPNTFLLDSGVKGGHKYNYSLSKEIIPCAKKIIIWIRVEATMLFW